MQGTGSSADVKWFFPKSEREGMHGLHILRYQSETWAVQVEDMARLERPNESMVW